MAPNRQSVPPGRGGKLFSVQTRGRHPFPDQLVIGLHEPVLSLALIEQGTEFLEDAGLPFRSEAPKSRNLAKNKDRHFVRLFR